MQALARANEGTRLLEQIPLRQEAAANPRQFSPGTRGQGQTDALDIVPKPLGSTSRDSERANTRGALEKIHAGAPPNVPAVIPEAPGRRGLPWISSALVFAAAAGLTFGLVYSGGLSSADHTPGFLKGFFAAPGLGLRLESQGDRLLLGWNRHHPAVRNTKGGILQIDDGPQHRRISLDAAQISNGSVLYRPNSDDVIFRLEVEGAQGGKVSESMRVLEAAKPSTPDLSAPAATPVVSQTPAPPQQMDNATRDGKPPAQSSSVSVPKPTAMVAQRTVEAAANRSAAVQTTASRQVTRVPNAQPSPPDHNAVETPPVKQKAEAKGEVASDIVPPAPVQPGRSVPAASAPGGPAPAAATNQTEAARNTSPLGTNTPSAPVTERQNPLPSSNSAPTPPANNPIQQAVQPRTSALADYRAPRPLRQILPNISQLAPGTLAMAGKVEVIVKVNESGRVTEAHVINGARKINASLIGAAILAAKQWIFEPATLGGKRVPSEHSIVFQFQSSQ